jgi:hypothetical protein
MHPKKRRRVSPESRRGGEKDKDQSSKLFGSTMMDGLSRALRLFKVRILIYTALRREWKSSIDDITDRQFPVFLETGLSAGDLSVFLSSQIFLILIEYSVHLAAAIGTGNCPGAPRLRFFFGRPPPKAAAPDLTVPEPTGVYSTSN